MSQMIQINFGVHLLCLFCLFVAKMFAVGICYLDY